MLRLSSTSLLALAMGGLAACSDVAPSLPPDTATEISGVPTDRAALGQWLQGGAFRAWTGDASPRPPLPDSPHGTVRVFFNPTVEGALRTSTVPRPAGSVLVKEVQSGGAVAGYSVMIKVRDGSAASDWLFYEAFGGSVSTYNLGASGCVGCHQRGRDFVRSPLP